MTNNVPDATETISIEQKAIELRKTGASLGEIRTATGLTERQVRSLVQGVAKPLRRQRVASKVCTPFAKSIDRVLPLARRKHGIRDYELRRILHEEYGSTWNTSTGKYDSDYTVDNLKRVKSKVRDKLSEANCDAIFLPDWIDEIKPRASSDFLISAASDLVSRIDEYVTEFMTAHGTAQDADEVEGELARRKQRYAVRQHLLKLAIRNYGPEPVEKLLERTASLICELEGNPDLQYTARPNLNGGNAIPETSKYYPEPSRLDPFLDFVESQGWIRR